MTIQPSQVKLTINLISQGSVSVLYATPLCKSTIIFIMIFSLSPRHRTIGFTLNETGNDALCASFYARLGNHRLSPFSVVSHFLVMQLFSFTIFFCCNCSMSCHIMQCHSPTRALFCDVKFCGCCRHLPPQGRN